MSRHNGCVPFSRAGLYYGYALLALAGFMFVMFAALIATTPAKSEGRPACTTVEHLQQQAGRRFPRSMLVHVGTNYAADFMDRWNRIPPVSNHAATELLILFHNRGQVAETIFFKGGCSAYKATMPGPIAAAILKAINFKFEKTKPAPLKPKGTGA